MPADRGVVGGFQRLGVGAKLQLAPGGSGGWPVPGGGSGGWPVVCSAASRAIASWYSGMAVIGTPQGGM